MSMREYRTVCESTDEARNELKDCQCALLTMCQMVQTLKKDLIGTRDGVLEIMNAFPQLIRVCEDRLRHEIRQHCDGLRSNFELRIHDTVEELKISHDAESQRLNDVIRALDESMFVEVEKSKSLRVQLDDAANSMQNEVNNNTTLQAELRADAIKARDELRVAMEHITSIELQLEKEKIQKKRELCDVEQKMRAELDAIDGKVKSSFKKLSESKNKALDEALDRARVAEERANAAQKLMSDLRISVIQKVSTHPSGK